MRRKIYRTAAIATIISCAAMILLTWYAVGIIEKSNMEDTVSERVRSTVSLLDEKKSECDATAKQIYSDYKSKTRSLAMLLEKSPELMKDESKLEAIRMMNGADVISIADSSYNIEVTTGSAVSAPKIYEDFRGAVNSKVFSEAVVDRSGTSPKVITGCSRLDKSGVIQMEFSSESVNVLLEAADMSNILTGIPIMENGSLALFDPKTMTYISHTDKSMTGKPVLFDMGLSKKALKKGRLTDCSVNGTEMLMFCKSSKAGTVVGYVPYSEVYETRNDTMIWVFIAAVFIAAVIVLAVRNRILRINKSRKKRTE